MTDIAVDNHHAINGKPLILWPFLNAMVNYKRVMPKNMWTVSKIVEDHCMNGAVTLVGECQSYA